MKLLKVGAGVLNQTPMDWDNNAEHIRQAIRAAHGQRGTSLPLGGTVVNADTSKVYCSILWISYVAEGYNLTYVHRFISLVTFLAIDNEHY